MLYSSMESNNLALFSLWKLHWEVLVTNVVDISAKPRTSSNGPEAIDWDTSMCVSSKQHMTHACILLRANQGRTVRRPADRTPARAHMEAHGCYLQPSLHGPVDFDRRSTSMSISCMDEDGRSWQPAHLIVLRLFTCEIDRIDHIKSVSEDSLSEERHLY